MYTHKWENMLLNIHAYDEFSSENTQSTFFKEEIAVMETSLTPLHYMGIHVD